MEYELDLLKKMQGMKQVGKSIQEFYWVLIRTGHAKADKEKVARYLNGLRPSIQDELSLARMNSIEEAYQFSLRAHLAARIRKKLAYKIHKNL